MKYMEKKMIFSIIFNFIHLRPELTICFDTHEKKKTKTSTKKKKKTFFLFFLFLTNHNLV